MKRARAVFQSVAVQPVLIGSEVFPGQNVPTHQEILDAIKSSSDTIHHPAGTKRMGIVNDSMAVVDSASFQSASRTCSACRESDQFFFASSLARVIGVQGLRVVDASAFISPTSAGDIAKQAFVWNSALSGLELWAFTDMARCSRRENRGWYSWNGYCKFFTIGKLFSKLFRYLPKGHGEIVARNLFCITDGWTILICGFSDLSLDEKVMHEEYIWLYLLTCRLSYFFLALIRRTAKHLVIYFEIHQDPPT